MLSIDDINKLQQENASLKFKCLDLEHENNYMKGLMQKANPVAWADEFHIWAYSELKKEKNRLEEKLKELERFEFINKYPERLFKALVELSEYPSIEIKSYPFEYGSIRYRGELTTALGSIIASEFVIQKEYKQHEDALNAMQEKILHDIGYQYVKRAYDTKKKYILSNEPQYIYACRKFYEELQGNA